MDLLFTKREIISEVDKLSDEKILTAIARLLNLNTNDSSQWHSSTVEERFAEYERNPQNVISWDELKKKWKNEI